MKVLILYRPNSEHGRLVEDFIHNIESRPARYQVEVLSVDTRDGSAMASLYDVMQYPAVLVLQTDGQLQRSWVGETLPMTEEVASYAMF